MYITLLFAGKLINKQLVAGCLVHSISGCTRTQLVVLVSKPPDHIRVSDVMAAGAAQCRIRYDLLHDPAIRTLSRIRAHADR